MGPTFPELVEALPDIEIIDHSSVNAFDDARVARAIEATGRKKLIFAGISLEVCAAFPAITAVGKGLDAYVAVDASGTFSETKRQVGLLRMLQAGVIVALTRSRNLRPCHGEVGRQTRQKSTHSRVCIVGNGTGIFSFWLARYSGAVLGRADEASFGLRVLPSFLTCAGRRSAHFRMASSAGHRDCPHDVRLYSTLGGTCG